MAMNIDAPMRSVQQERDETTKLQIAFDQTYSELMAIESMTRKSLAQDIENMRVRITDLRRFQETRPRLPELSGMMPSEAYPSAVDRGY